MHPPPFPPGLRGPLDQGPSGFAARARAFVRAHPRLRLAGAVALVLLLVYPFAVGALAAHLAESRLSAKLGRAVTVGHGRAGLGQIVLEDVTIPGAAGGPPLATIARLTIPFGLALGLHSAVEVIGLRVHAVRGGNDDNLEAILAKVNGRGHHAEAAPPPAAGAAPTEAAGPTETAAPTEAAGPSLPDVILKDATIEARDEKSHLRLSIAGLDGEIRPGARLALRMRAVKGGLMLGGEGEGPRFGADELDVETPLTGMRPSGIPALRVAGGSASPLPQLALTGIAGVIGPPPADAAGKPGAGAGLVIDLRGSYGGAHEALWTAKGHADPAHGIGRLSLRAEQFSLGRIADVLPPSVLAPGNTTLDAALDLDWSGDAVNFGGELAVVGLSLQSEALAADPVQNVSLGLNLRGTVYPLARRLDLERAEVRVRDVTARLTGHVAMPAGTFRFTNGKTLSVVPDIDLHFSVPRVSCAKLLASIPSALVPRLEGFVLQGFFASDVGVKIDFAHLDDLDLSGKVGIDGCKVVKAPADVKALADPETLVINVEVPKLPGGQPGETDTIPVVVGPENPDFAPYDQISPYLVGSIMTTEDNGFFKHHGWVSSEFKSALRRNLQGGGFRLGASSITMQMVKNVLLTKDKTLSRKLQELFLVWYLEQVLPKERILELYFNAIEFGPRIYGIGAATRHYFGKKPADLNPLEAAFFSSILPSPKRRYVQYCHGSLSPQWDRYVRRILAKVHERGRITDDEYATFSTQPFVFDRSEASFTEKQCLDWVKSMAPKPEPETPPDLEEGDAGADASDWPQKRLKRLFSHAVAHRTPAPSTSKSIVARTH
ncbi:MAG TPA: biosynthetic peptidoglycan transglycosylase [Polyangia bacterium]|nr:biosynthetic peptidoglycan transglycosylase [Polyangia bacterium]